MVEPVQSHTGPEREPETECETCGTAGVEDSANCPTCAGAASEARSTYGFVPF